MGQLEGSDGQLEGSEGQPAGSEGQPAGSESQPAGSEGQQEGGWMDKRTDGQIEFLPILQDFVPCWGRCPKRLVRNLFAKIVDSWSISLEARGLGPEG